MLDKKIEKSDSFISLVIVGSELQEENIISVVGNINNYLCALYDDYEIVIIEDVPGNVPKKQLSKLLTTVPSIRFIELSYVVDFEIAVTVGLENSIGDYVFIYNPTSDPVEVIEGMVDVCKSKHVDVVIGVATNLKKSVGYKVVKPLVNFAIKEINYTLPNNATTLRCLSRNAVNSATKASNAHQNVFVRLAHCGASFCSYEYSINIISQRKKTLFSSVANTISLLVFNSTKPLRWMSLLGATGSFFAFSFASYSFILGLINNEIADGWSSITVLVSFLFMLLFIILSFFGEYLSRLLNEQNRHEAYWIINEKHSSVMVNENRSNVLEESDRK